MSKVVYGVITVLIFGLLMSGCLGDEIGEAKSRCESDISERSI